MSNYKNMIGFKVGRLEVVSFSHTTGTRHWLCRCECGNEKVISGASLRTKKPTLSCGCLIRSGIPNSKHGMSNTPTYETYRAMRKRCESKNDIEYPNYGGRGITVCEGWETFDGFFADMGVRPKGETLDRLDTDGNYCKENCRWSTPKEQAMNRRNSVTLTVDGVEKHITEWADISGVRWETIKGRISHGWDIEKAIFTNTNNHQKLLNIDGEVKNLSEWAEIYGIQNQLISYRLKNGWSEVDAVTIRPRGKRNNYV